VLIVGDFTARVGDPSGKSETRPRLDKEVVRAFAKRLLGQFSKVLSEERLEVRYNSEWLEPMDMEAVLRLTASYTVARMLERDDFSKRFAEGRPISLMEFLYPLLQAMDSVAVEADAELGGTDQKFNLLVGREIQRDYGQEPQVVFTMPLLEGLDGVQKMSQSLGNYVGVTEPPQEMFGKLMRVPDQLITKYIELCTSMDPSSVADMPPNGAKRAMARAVVALYHGEEAAKAAEERFDLVHRRHEVPDDVPVVILPPELAGSGRIWLPKLLVALGLASSNSEGRRLIEQGGVRIDGEPVADPGAEVPAADLPGRVVQVGSHRFMRIGESP
jgi:tyrosyl-tRNA synthetase